MNFTQAWNLAKRLPLREALSAYLAAGANVSAAEDAVEAFVDGDWERRVTTTDGGFYVTAEEVVKQRGLWAFVIHEREERSSLGTQ